MADPLADIERLVAMFRAAGSRDTEMQALLGQVSTALADILAVLEKPRADDSAALAAALAGLKLPAPTVQVAPVLKSDWRSLSVTFTRDKAGTATGMTLTKQ